MPAANKKWTLFSLVPMKIAMNRPGMYPNEFNLDESDGTIPTSCLVKEGWYENLGMDHIRYNTPISAKDIARSLVKDYKASQIWNKSDASAPLWTLAGDIQVAKIPQDIYEAQYEMCRKWLARYIEDADDAYARMKMSGFSATPLQIAAARVLKLSKPWALELNWVAPEIAKAGNLKKAMAA